MKSDQSESSLSQDSAITRISSPPQTSHLHDITSLKNAVDEHLRGIAEKRPYDRQQSDSYPGIDGPDSSLNRVEDRNSFDRLITEGSVSSNRKTKKDGSLRVLVLLSFVISLAFPLFWFVFALLSISWLAASAHEWMG